MAVKERDVVLLGKDGEDSTIDMPITRLGLIEDGAEAKTTLADADAIPVVDSADSGEMKKIAWGDAMGAIKGKLDGVYATVESAAEAKETAGAALTTSQEAKREAAAALAAAGTAQETADAALEAITKLAHTIDAVPTQNGTLTYNGRAQTPVWNSYDPEVLTLGGVTTGTNAGSYTATFEPKEGYTWSDGTNTARSVTWSIGRLALGAVPSQSGTLTYNGSAQSPEWSGRNDAMMTIGGTTTGTNAGTYTATFTPTANYEWSDGTITAKSVMWTIGRATISTVPSQSGSLTYTGSALSPAWSNYDAAKMTIGGTTSGTNAGSYSATFTPTGNYQWSGGATGAKSVTWTIGKAAGSLTISKTSMTLTNGALTGTITATRAGNGTISATSSNTSIATVSVSGTTVTVAGKAYGNVTITVKVAAGTNHNAPANKTCSVAVKIYSTTLNSNTWAQIREASDTGKAASIWSVGDTKNIQLNGYVGNITLSNLSIDVFVLGFNHNSSREGSNRIHFQIGKIEGTLVGLVGNGYGNVYTDSGYFNMNISKTNRGGWAGCRMRKNLLGNAGTPVEPPADSLLASLPPDLCAVMKPCTKYTDNSGGGSNSAAYVTNSTDFIFLLAEFEYFGVRAFANTAEKTYQMQYDYYKAGNSREHYKHKSITDRAYIWCRSVSLDDSNFCMVKLDGSASGHSAYYSYGITPAFCV